jgi:hypothetical protein
MQRALITRYQASREPHDVTFAQLLIVVWKMSTFSEERFVGVSEAEPSTDIDQGRYRSRDDNSPDMEKGMH